MPVLQRKTVGGYDNVLCLSWWSRQRFFLRKGEHTEIWRISGSEREMREAREQHARGWGVAIQGTKRPAVAGAGSNARLLPGT